MTRQMKDSGIEWIGEIPVEWDFSKSKYLFQDGSGSLKIGPFGSAIRGKTLESGKYKIYNQAHLISNDFAMERHYVSEETFEELNAYEVTPGDLLFSMMGTIGKCRIMPEGFPKGIMDSHLLKARLNNKINPRFFVYIYDKDYSPIVINQLLYYSKGSIMNGLNSQIVKNVIIPLPPKEEQEMIADFLDQQCAHIDSVLEQTRASIEEYKRLKQVVITQAVTKGVRGDRPMKDSGSVWFSAIPESWVMRKLKFVFSIKKDIAGKEGYTILSITQRGIVPKDISKNEGQLAANYSNYQLVEPGDFAMNHMDLLTGWVDISKYSGVTSPDYRVFVLNDAEHNCDRYYLYMMQMCYSNKIFYGLGQGVSGLGRWRLQADKFMNFEIAVPPTEEQIEIADYLDEKCAKIDNLIAKKEQFLNELEAYKKSMIYEYVTGKKEVPQV